MSDNPFTAQGEAQTKRRTSSRPTLRNLDPDFQDMRTAANPFEAIADAQRSGVSKARERAGKKISERAAAKRELKNSPLELKRQEDNELAKLYRKWKREQREGIVDRIGEPMREMVSLLRGLDRSAFDDLAAYVLGAEWLSREDIQTRLFVLGLIDAAMCRANVRDGRPPIDDPLWDEPESPFLIIRRHLTGV